MKAYETVLRLTDDAIPHILYARQDDPNRFDYRGQISHEKGFAEPSHSGTAAATLLSAYFCADSRWHGDASILDAAISALSFLIESLHEDGSFDLVETNFHDCTSNGFSVRVLAYTYRLLERFAKSEKELEAKALVRDFLQKSARAMMTGGFHTPNHRWVVASALSLCYNILGDDCGEQCLETAKAYLSEGIDCDDEGEYTEHSVGIYDAVNNESLMILAQELGMTELYGAVDRNLEKNWYYTEPDLTGLTLASRRQDHGKEPQMVHHFHAYYRAAERTGSGRFAWMANRLLERLEHLRVNIGPPREIGASLYHQNLLTRFILEPAVELPAEEPMPLHYTRYFERLGVVRHRSGEWTCSLLRENSAFMKLQNGSLKVYVKLACTFFQHGRLLAQQIIPIDNGYRLVYEREWGYLRPLPGINEPDWWKIDHKSRENANMQKHCWQVDVVFRESGLTMRVRTEGTPRVPVKLECALTPGGLIKTFEPLGTGHMTLPAMPEGWVIAGENVAYDLDGNIFCLSGGFNEHHYAPIMRNSDPPPRDRFCLYCTGFTPMDRTLEIDFKC